MEVLLYILDMDIFFHIYNTAEHTQLFTEKSLKIAHRHPAYAGHYY